MNNVLDFFRSRGIPEEFLKWDEFLYTGAYIKSLEKLNLANKVDSLKLLAKLVESRDFITEDFKPGKAGYFFQGCNGSGKTGWASVLIREALITGVNSMITSMQSLMTAYYNDHKLPKDVAIVDLLVIDELGKELQKNSSSAILLGVLDRRYQDGKKTILIANASADKLIELYGATFHSKLHYFTPIFFPEVDLRKNIKALQKDAINNDGNIKTIKVDDI